jgi:hypothetical protein
VSEEKIRLGGMALANGVLVHGPTRGPARPHGRRELKVVARRKRFSGAKIESPLLRGPAAARTRSRSSRRSAARCRKRGCRSSARRARAMVAARSRRLVRTLASSAPRRRSS